MSRFLMSSLGIDLYYLHVQCYLKLSVITKFEINRRVPAMDPEIFGVGIMQSATLYKYTGNKSM